MPKPITTQFQAFEFTEQEFYGATRFTEMNLMLFQTLAARAAQNKVELKIDLNKPREEAISEFVQREAELQGEMGAYNHLINLFSDVVPPEVQSADKKADISPSTSFRV